MRIAVFSDNFYPELSGVADVISVLAKELGKLGHQIMIFVPYYSKKDFLRIKKDKQEIFLGASVKIFRMLSLPCPFVGTRQARAVILGSGFFALKKFKPDIIHSHQFFGAGLNALFFSKILSVPLVGTNHTFIEAIAKAALFKSDWLTKILSFYQIWYYNHCKLVTAPTTWILNKMARDGLSVKTEVLANPVDSSIFNFTPAQRNLLRKKYNLSGSVLVYAGRLAKDKKVDVLMHSFASIIKIIPQSTLLICGHGVEDKHLGKLCEDLKIGDKVLFFGSVDHHILSELYNASDIFVISSTSELQSMTVLQAMACGLPIVAASAGGLVDLINERNAALFAPENFIEMAQKIIFLLQSEKIYKVCQYQALLDSERFFLPAIAKQWEGVYNTVLE